VHFSTVLRVEEQKKLLGINGDTLYIRANLVSRLYQNPHFSQTSLKALLLDICTARQRVLLPSNFAGTYLSQLNLHVQFARCGKDIGTERVEWGGVDL